MGGGPIIKRVIASHAQHLALRNEPKQQTVDPQLRENKRADRCYLHAHPNQAANQTANRTRQTMENRPLLAIGVNLSCLLEQFH